MRKQLLPAIGLSMIVGFTGSSNATVFGLKNCGSGFVNNSACFNGQVLGGGSMAPTMLFSFGEAAGSINAGSTVVTSGGQGIHADALAINGANTLFAYELTTSVVQTGPSVSANVTASQLVTLNQATGAVSSTIGANMTGRDIRGAAFGSDGNLLAVDATSNELLRINPNTGGIISSVGLTVGAMSFDLGTSSDIALQSDGTAFLVDLGNFYQLNLTSGELALVFGDNGTFSGLAFSDLAADDLLFGYEVGGTEDIFTFDLANANASTQTITNFLPSLGGELFNAGRGDLAAVVTFDPAQVPEPGTLALFGLGLAGLGLARRRKAA